ncbi:MAG: cupin domain-containing protein [Steroidobacteraceae bacterium]
MRISLKEAQAKLPFPATKEWPEGVWHTLGFGHGSMTVELFTPRDRDYQISHQQDELYIVLKGSGVLLVEGVRHPFEAGDALFVAANQVHRFEKFSQDLVTWAVFWGPRDGDKV